MEGYRKLAKHERCALFIRNPSHAPYLLLLALRPLRFKPPGG